MFAIVSSMIASGKWTVAYSCNSTVAGTAGDGVNRWSSAASLVWSGNAAAHSWIVLKNVGISSNYQICIDLNHNGTTSINCTIVRSMSAGFTGGSTTARPTATDQFIALNAAGWGGPTADQAMRWSTEISTDGNCNRVIIAGGGSLRGLWVFEKMSSPETGVTYPIGDYVTGTSAGSISPATGAWNIFPIAATSGTGAIGFVTQLTGLTSPSSFTTNWPIVPAALIGNTTGCFGYIGMFQDMWMGSGSVATGDSYPGAPNWTASTSYPTSGTQVTNGSNVYTLVTPGTSASSGGPTGTGTGITDGTCVWNFFSATLAYVQIGQYVFPWNNGPFNLT